MYSHKQTSEGELPLCQLPTLNQNINGRFPRRISLVSVQNKSRVETIPNGPHQVLVGGLESSSGCIGPAGLSGVGPGSWYDSPRSSALPGSGCSTAPSSSKLIYNGNDNQRFFFPKEVTRDLRAYSPGGTLDTAFSCDSLGSQVGSRQSLLDSKGKTRLVDESPLSPITKSQPRIGNAGLDMDISRRQREVRRKEIQDKLRLDPWAGERSRKRGGKDGRACRWTFVFDPSGGLVYYWSVVVSLAFLYNFWVIIFRTAFLEISSDSLFIWFPLDYLADLIYLMDILIHFRTAYLEDGVLQTDSTKLRQHYMNSTTFYIDMLCLLPLDFLYLSLHFQSMLRVCRLVKIYRFWQFLDKTERHTNYPNLFRIFSLVHYLLVAFHWNACVFYILHKETGFGPYSELFGGKRFKELTKDEVNVNSEPIPPDIGELYLLSYYWTVLAMTTIGNLPHPRTKSQLVYVILQILIGLMTFATVLGYIASIVTNISAARKDFQAKLDGVKIYMRIRKVPGNIQNKVIKWFDYLWLTQKSSDEEKSINCLPDKLKGEIAIHVHLNTLKRVEIFQNTEAGFLCELVLRLKPILFSPGDYICRKGEVGKEMYICNRGRLQVVDTDGKTVLATLKAGSYFGEISILNMGTAGNRRTASVRSVGYSDLFVLSKQDMWDVLKDYPAARVRLEAIAGKKLEKYKKIPLEKAALPRSLSTPGLLESRGRIPLEEMWVSPCPLLTGQGQRSPGARGNYPRAVSPQSFSQQIHSAVQSPDLVRNAGDSPMSMKSVRRRGGGLEGWSGGVEGRGGGFETDSRRPPPGKTSPHPQSIKQLVQIESETSQESDVSSSAKFVTHSTASAPGRAQVKQPPPPVIKGIQNQGGGKGCVGLGRGPARPNQLDHGSGGSHVGSGGNQPSTRIICSAQNYSQHTLQVIAPTPSPSTSDSNLQTTHHITGRGGDFYSVENGAHVSDGSGCLSLPDPGGCTAGGGSISPGGCTAGSISAASTRPSSKLLNPNSSSGPMYLSSPSPSMTDSLAGGSPSCHQESSLGHLDTPGSGQLDTPGSGQLDISPQAAQNSGQLIREIKRLRERLKTLECENTSMSVQLSQTQRNMNQRLTEIELQIGCDSDEETEISQREEEERNQESFI